MGRGWLIPLIPIGLAILNHYFNHQRQKWRDKEDQKQVEKRQPSRRKEVIYDHEHEDE